MIDVYYCHSPLMTHGVNVLEQPKNRKEMWNENAMFLDDRGDSWPNFLGSRM